MNVHVHNLAYAGDVVRMSNKYRGMENLLEVVSRHVATAGIHSTASKTKALSAIILDERRPALLIDVEILNDVSSLITSTPCVSQKNRALKRSETK